MKIIKITEACGVYSVDIKPSWIGRLFGATERTEKFKCDGGNTYKFGGGYVYYNQKGVTLDNYHQIGVAIDRYRRMF